MFSQISKIVLLSCLIVLQVSAAEKTNKKADTGSVDTLPNEGNNYKGIAAKIERLYEDCQKKLAAESTTKGQILELNSHIKSSQVDLEKSVEELEDCLNNLKKQEEVIGTKNADIIDLQNQIQQVKIELGEKQLSIDNSDTICNDKIKGVSESADGICNGKIEDISKLHNSKIDEIVTSERSNAASQCEESLEKKSQAVLEGCKEESHEQIVILQAEHEKALNVLKETQGKACTDQIESVKQDIQQVCHDELRNVEKKSEDKCMNDKETLKAEELENCNAKLVAEVKNQNTECEQKLSTVKEDMTSSCAADTAKANIQNVYECEDKIQAVTDSAKQQEEAKIGEIQLNNQKLLAEQETKLTGDCQAQMEKALSSSEEQCTLQSTEKINDLTKECAQKLKSSQESSQNVIKKSQENLQSCEISSNECKDQLQQSQTQSEMLKNMLETKDKELLQKEEEAKLLSGSIANGFEKEELVLYLLAAIGVAAVLFLYIVIGCIVSRCCGGSSSAADNYLTMEELTTPLKQNGVSKQNGSAKKAKKEKQSKKNK